MSYPIFLLAISLSMDAFSAGLVYGLRQIKIPLSSKLLIVMFSVIYTGVALLAGKSLSGFVPFQVSKKLGASILVMMGIWIIVQTLHKNNRTPPEKIETTAPKTLLKIGFKSLGITVHIFKNPVEFDLDSSGAIDTGESLLLGLELSLDSIGVGIGSALLGFHSLLIPFTVGLFQWLSLSLGAYLGEKCALSFNLDQKWLGLIPGIILLFLALLRI
ncbi:MAG: sporulation membrane protein YtaF [Firmicutes bacterium]|nr:sporulation membrane protein YtaF [Bacillota bacterium]